MSIQKYKDINLYSHEEQLQDDGYNFVCGVDEAGRGPLAGPCVVAAVIMPLTSRIEGINDSKQLSAKKREELYKLIMQQAIAVNVVFVGVKEIDEMNIYQATKNGMLKAVKGLKQEPDYVLIDAMPLNELELPHESIIHGDAKSASIAAASIVAKVTRDHYMEKMDIKYPGYGFAHHKGYCTKEHVEALKKLGPCAIHRRTYSPVSSYFCKQLEFDFNEEK